MELLNLSKEQSIQLLDLRKDKIKVCLEKKPNVNKPARVAVVLDFSGSMGNRYRSGLMQAVIERVFPIALALDDDGSMQVWIFSNGFWRLIDITMDNFYGYVAKEIMNGKYHMGGTKYAPVMEDVVNYYTKEEPASIPSYIMYMTDGDNSDKDATKQILIDSSVYPIFWQFIGIKEYSNSRFPFLEQLDDMVSRYVDNANFFPLEERDLTEKSDEEIYEMLLAEYPDWLANEKVQAILRGEKPAFTTGTQQAKGKKGLFGKLFQ